MNGLKLHLLFVIIIITFSCSSTHNSIEKEITKLETEIFIELAQFENGKLVTNKLFAINGKIENHQIDFANSKIELTSSMTPDSRVENTYNISITSTLTEGDIQGFALGVKLFFNNWNQENYVLMPGSVYKGNRFHSIKKIRKVPTYEALETHPGKGPLVTNVPRLNIDTTKESLLQQLSGDMATPSIGIHFNNYNKLFLFLTPQNERNYQDYSYKLWENEGHSKSELTIRTPGVREDSVFKGGGLDFFPSTDSGMSLHQGEKVVFEGKIIISEAENISDLFETFTSVRKSFGTDTIPPEIPLSAAWEIMEKKYNHQNWVEKYGYYSVGMRESTYQDWQTGWVGGMNTVFPLLVMGNDTTFNRALQTFDFLFDSISPSGLFYEVFHDGKWHLKKDASFLRRNSDALYFIMKSFEVIKNKHPELQIPDKWSNAAKGAADLYVELWNNYGEFGQQVEFETGKLVAQGTSSNGIASAALTLCGEYFKDTTYLDIAKKAADQYYKNYVLNGYTNGGPGDIYQTVDSESAFGLLESFVVLYEYTTDKKWLNYAKELANQCASWVVSYNYQFPENSTFHNLDMKTTGTVIANAQNKHSAPGICTLSGNSLLKLYRYTGNQFYMDLLSDIVRTLPQYMSRADRPIPDTRPDVRWPVMPPGWINERVNLSDWEERGNPGDIKRGEIFGGSTWSESAFLNSMADIPGIYILKEAEKIWIIDHIEATLIDDQLIIHNPTQYPAEVSIMIETTSEQAYVLNPNYNLNFRTVRVQPQKTETLVLN